MKGKQHTEKPTRYVSDVPKVWAEWKLTAHWQQCIFELLQKNQQTNIFDFSGVSETPRNLQTGHFQKELSLFILLFLYAEIPYQIGIYNISRFHNKFKKYINPEEFIPEDEISGISACENLLFSKMGASSGLRNFVMKYIEFAFYIQTVIFKSQYQKYRVIYTLLKDLFPRDSRHFNQMQHVQQEQIRNYLKGAESKYTKTSQKEIVYKMSSGFSLMIEGVLSDQDYTETNAIYSENFPIYPYLKDYLTLGACRYKFEHFHLFLDYTNEPNSSSYMMPWIDFERDHIPPRYLT